MSTFHAVVWIDHQEAHVMMFDREHMQAQRIHSRSHHKHQGKQQPGKKLLKPSTQKVEKLLRNFGMSGVFRTRPCTRSKVCLRHPLRSHPPAKP